MQNPNQMYTNTEVYFCESSNPWQRASNENTNGLLRQHVLKKHEPVSSFVGAPEPDCQQVPYIHLSAFLASLH